MNQTVVAAEIQAAAPEQTEVTAVDFAPTWTSGPESSARHQEWAAESADGQWLYQRMEDSGRRQQWDVRHVPTGHIEHLFATTLDKARQWTASSGLEQIRAKAQRVIETGGQESGVIHFPPPGLAADQLEQWQADRRRRDAELAADRCARSRAVLAVLDGELLPAGADVETVCECGGFLTWVQQPAFKGWRHVNGCPDCWSPQRGWNREVMCLSPARHRWCTTAEPVSCGHSGCLSDMQTGVMCGAGKEACCGCCQGPQPVEDGE